MEDPSSKTDGKQNEPDLTRKDQPAAGRKPTGDGGCLGGSFLLLVGGAMLSYWFLFMGWSHSFSSPDFQRREFMIKNGGMVFAIVGAILLVRWWTGSGPEKPQN